MNSAEKQCLACDAIIPKSAEVCPDCGSSQAAPPIAKPSGTSRVLKGCLIAVAVVFAGTIVIGIVAAIAIPKFAMTKQKAYIASMKADLRNLSAAEDAYYEAHKVYQPNVAALEGFTFSHGVSLARPIEVDQNGWTATVRRDETAVQCTVKAGDRGSVSGVESVPTCGAAELESPVVP